MRISTSVAVVAGLLAVASDAAFAQGAAAKAPSGLTVTQASKSAVVLTWTPADASTPSIVERKLLGAQWPAVGATPSATIGTVDTARFSDSTIDQSATYVYRVRARGTGAPSAPSNEVTVGPPPTGFSQVITAPKAMHDHDPAQFAGVISMALDANGDPAFAYLVSDLNNDGENPDSALDFISWNRATYRWNPPVRVAIVGDVARSGTRPAFSLAFDGVSRAGIAYLVTDRQMQFALSTDSGVTWTSSVLQQVSSESAGLSTPSLVLDGEKAYVGYLAEREVVLASGAVTEKPSAWAKQKAPLLPGTGEVRAECISVAVDAEHRPAMTYCLNAADGYNVTVAFWRPGQSAVKAMDTDGHQTDDPSAKLAVTGSRMAVVFYGARDDKFFNGHHVWMTKSADQGATWASPSLAADDGGHEMAAPVSIAIDGAGRYAMGASIGGGNEAAAKCGMPSLMRSSDGTTWTTCAPNTKGFPSEADPRDPLVTFAANSKVYEVFRTQQPATGVGAGLVLWREP